MGSICGDATLSDLEFQRELSPEQIREALSLLDGAVGAQSQMGQIEDLRPAEEINPEPDQSSTTPTQDQPPAAEDPRQRTKHLRSAAAFFGIGIVAAGALALLSWRESVPLSPKPGIAQVQLSPAPGIAQVQVSKPSVAPAAKSDSPASPVAEPPPDQNPGASERQPLPLELASLSGAGRDAVNNDNAIPSVVPSATDHVTSPSRARSNERLNRRPEHTSRYARAVRMAAAKKRIWRLHREARAEDEWCIVACRRPNGEWCFFGCRFGRAQTVTE